LGLSKSSPCRGGSSQVLLKASIVSSTVIHRYREHRVYAMKTGGAGEAEAEED